MRPALALAALALLAACGADDGGGAVDEAAATTNSEAPATSTSSTTIAAPTTSTSAPGPACPGQPVGTAVDAASTDAQLDGDGQLDFAYAYQLGPANWTLRVDFADGGSTEEELTTTPQDVARVVAVRDLDDDGTDELFVQVGTGAAVVIVGLFAVDGCDIEPILLDGSPATFAIGGTVLLLQGLACGASDVTHLGATSDDGATYATLDLTYELEDGQLVRVGDETGTLTADDPALASYSDVAC